MKFLNKFHWRLRSTGRSLVIDLECFFMFLHVNYERNTKNNNILQIFAFALPVFMNRILVQSCIEQKDLPASIGTVCVCCEIDCLR